MGRRPREPFAFPSVPALFPPLPQGLTPPAMAQPTQPPLTIQAARHELQATSHELRATGQENSFVIAKTNRSQSPKRPALDRDQDPGGQSPYAPQRPQARPPRAFSVKCLVSRHAKDEMVRRQIPREWLESVFDNPQQRIGQPGGREILGSPWSSRVGKCSGSSGNGESVPPLR